MGKHGALKQYLSDLGLLGSKDREAIDEAKKAYRREYMKKYKQERRKRVREVMISLENSECRRIEREARKYGMTVPVFILAMTDSFCRKVPISPHPEKLGDLKTILTKLYLEIRETSNDVSTNAPALNCILEKLELIEDAVEEISSLGNLEDHLTELLENDASEDTLALLSRLISKYNAA